MAAARLKKLSIVSSREDFESVLQDLILLGCIEISEPPELSDNMEAASCFSREKIALDQYSANLESIELLGTQHTLLLSGWLTVRAETQLISKLVNYTCAWEVEDLTTEDSLIAPVDLCCPNFFGKLRRGDRKQFAPLARGSAI